jgi:hypothetical protein
VPNLERRVKAGKNHMQASEQLLKEALAGFQEMMAKIR